MRGDMVIGDPVGTGTATRRPYVRPVTSTEHVFKFIIDFKKSHDGNSPSIREIGEGCGISSTSVVTYWLNKLEEQGFIRRPEPPFGIRFANRIEVIGGQWKKEDSCG